MGAAKKRGPEGFISRIEVCQRFGVTLNTVKAWHEKGILRGKKQDRRWWYSPEEIESCSSYHKAWRPRDIGERDARAVELFRDGSTVADVVVELRVTFDIAAQLQKRLSEGGGIYLDSETFAAVAARLRRRGILVRGVPTFVESIGRLCDSHAELERLRVGGAI